ncbi:hypothetical protein L484_026711 [Morus notabilis]|uniref:Zinc-finger domain-containing protein n=2 Tax=Morus notabilis TaxID=981085 RepID=W9SKN0_9ROSA|nr:hypothetical protein L484_026711 [Morus notabilis]
MAAPRGRGRRRRNPETPPANPSHSISTDEHPKTQKNEIVISEYEQSREERIKQNLQKMQKLGIFDLSLHLKSSLRTPRNSSCPNMNKIPPSISPLQPSGSIRRSSRLKNSTPVSYSEVDLVKKDKELGDDESVLAEAGSKPEIYTEEHEKLLGNTDKSWTLFVDGCGSDGKRIYDSVKGKTCHQCRQKTLGYRTHCSSCNAVRGQFCGDCLYMRYGEHVLEAIENPNWICPVCRGICNCSFCRQAKGWAPTGTLYKKISQLGFKSVAHYLIQARRAEKKLEKSGDTKNEVYVKRSLFSDMKVLSEDSLEVTNEHPGSPEQFKDKTDDDTKNNNGNQNSENIGSLEVDHKVDDVLGSSEHQRQNEKADTCQNEKDKESHEVERGNSEIVFKNTDVQATESRMVRIADNDFPETEERVLDRKHAVNGIALQKEMDEENDTPKVETSTGITVITHDDGFLGIVFEKLSNVKQPVGVSSLNKVEDEKELLPSDIKHHDVSTPLESSPKLKQKRVHPSLDSIGGRVRQRRKTGHNYDEAQGMLEKENSDLKQAAKH